MINSQRNDPVPHQSRRYWVTFFMQIFMQICITYRLVSPRIAMKCTFSVYFSTKKSLYRLYFMRATGLVFIYHTLENQLFYANFYADIKKEGHQCPKRNILCRFLGINKKRGASMPLFCFNFVSFFVRSDLQ